MTYLKITKGFELNRLFKLNIEQHWPWVFSYTMVYYTPVSDIILFSSANLKKLSGYQRYQQTSRIAICKVLDRFEIIENRSNSKSISDNGVWCNER